MVYFLIIFTISFTFNKCIKHYITEPPTNLKIVNAAEHTITYGKEGVRIELTCTVKNGIPATTLIWSKNGLTVANSSSDILLYRFIPTRSDHMQNITCYALSDLLTSPLSQTILLDIQCKSTIKVGKKKDQLCSHYTIYFVDICI